MSRPDFPLFCLQIWEVIEFHPYGIPTPDLLTLERKLKGVRQEVRNLQVTQMRPGTITHEGAAERNVNFNSSWSVAPTNVSLMAGRVFFVPRCECPTGPQAALRSPQSLGFLLPNGLLFMPSDKRSPHYDGPKHAWLSDRFLLLLAFVLIVASYLFLR